MTRRRDIILAKPDGSELSYATHSCKLSTRAGGIVKPVDQFPIYELGVALGQLRDVCSRSAAAAMDQLQALWTAESHLRKLLGGQPFTISFCRDAAESLHRDVRRAYAHFKHDTEESFDPSKPPLETWALYGVRTNLDIFEHQFSAEIKKTATYAVPQRGIFNTELLVDHAEAHIPESLRSAVPEFAVSEFQAAGRALAFGLFSASGFHSARAVECVLKAYYVSFLGEPKKDEMPMGLMASHLADARVAKENEGKVLPRESTIRHIKDVTNYDRNPLMHKNITLDEVEATTLFNSAVGAIVAMTKELTENARNDLELAAGSAAAALLGPEAAKKLALPKKPKLIQKQET